jgi:hypothetical protein
MSYGSGNEETPVIVVVLSSAKQRTRLVHHNTCRIGSLLVGGVFGGPGGYTGG